MRNIAALRGSVFGTGMMSAIPHAILGETTPPEPLVILHQSLFDHAANTGMVSAGDASANTLGVGFRSLVSGWATKIKFYKTALDTATSRNVGLWDDVFTTLLATGTTVAEPPGPVWITVDLNTPVRIEPMRVYVPGVHFPNGHYPAQAGGLTTAVKRGFLEAMADADVASGAGNGRYSPGASLTRPNANFNAPNYWIDVVVDIPEWVNAETSGIPEGTVLTPYTGNMVVSTNGAVIENLQITGSIRVTADNVTVKNVEFIANGAYHLVLIEEQVLGAVVKDCRIKGAGQAMNAILGRGVFHRNHITGVSNGIAVNGPADIRDNFMNEFFYDVVDPHYDGIENNGGTLQKYIHNTIHVEPTQTSCIMLDNAFAGLSQIEVAYNYCTGAGYTMYCDAQFSDVNVVDGPTIDIHHNRCQRGFYGYIVVGAGVFVGPVPHDNYDAITGLPID